jgi:hypothetical protein
MCFILLVAAADKQLKVCSFNNYAFEILGELGSEDLNVWKWNSFKHFGSLLALFISQALCFIAYSFTSPL